MRLKFYLWILLCMLAINGIGQTLNKYFTIDSQSTVAYSIECRNNSFFVSGEITDPSVPGGLKSFLAKVDSNGNLLSSSTFRPSQYRQYVDCWRNSLITTADMGFATTGYAKDTGTGIEHACFTKYDSTGNLQFYTIYNPDTFSYRHFWGLKTIQYANKYFIVCSIQLANYEIKTVLLSIDSVGNLEHFRIFNSLPLDNAPLGLCRLPNGNLLISSYSTDNNINYWQSIQNTCYLVVDTACNLIRQSCTTDGNTLTYYKVDTTPDGSYLAAGSYYGNRVQGLGYDFKEYITKMDTSFNLIWNTQFGYLGSENATNDFKQDTSMNIYLCGHNYHDTAFANDYGQGGTLARITKNGGIDWFRVYILPTSLQPDYSRNYLYDVELLPAGDIMAVGTWENNTNPSPLYYQDVAWLLRVHADGCLDGNDCGLTGIDEASCSNSSKEPFQVFPNPTNGIFTVRSTGLPLPGTTLEVYDNLGKKVYEQLLPGPSTLVNLYYLPNGIYTYRIGTHNNSENGKLTIQK